MAASGVDEYLKQRIILIEGVIEDGSATDIIAKLLYLNYLDSNKPLRLLVNSPGGSFTAGMAIMDTVDHIGPAVHTCCTGNASGIALALVAHGAKGHRTALPGADFVFTPIWAGEAGDGVAEQLEKDWQVLVDLLAKDTDRSASEVRQDMENSRRLSADDARANGIIDGIDQSPGWLS